MRSFRDTAGDSNAPALPSRPNLLLPLPSPAMKLNNPAGFFFTLFKKPTAANSPPDPASVMAAPIPRENNIAIDDGRAVVRDSLSSAASVAATITGKGARCRERIRPEPTSANIRAAADFLGAVRTAITNGTFDQPAERAVPGGLQASREARRAPTATASDREHYAEFGDKMSADDAKHVETESIEAAVFRKAVCAGFDHKMVALALMKRGERSAANRRTPTCQSGMAADSRNIGEARCARRLCSQSLLFPCPRGALETETLQGQSIVTNCAGGAYQFR